MHTAVHIFALVVLTAASGVDDARAASGPALQYAQPADILTWLDAGASVDQIVEAIDGAQSVPVTSEDIAKLRAAGVDDRIVRALTRRSLTKPAPPLVSPAGDLPTSDAASTASKAVEPQGFQAIVALGVNVGMGSTHDLVDEGDSPSVAATVSVGWRFTPFFSLALDLGIGFLTSPKINTPSFSMERDGEQALAVMATPRLHVQFGSFVLTGGAGIGYASYSRAEVVGGFLQDAEWSSPIAAKFLAGAGFKVQNVTVGILAEYYLHPEGDGVVVVNDFGQIGSPEVRDRAALMVYFSNR